jgi:hypothetical protein
MRKGEITFDEAEKQGTILPRHRGVWAQKTGLAK